ncbi:MAG TPA: response regulator [Anaeromyxobacteraceae bacterium]
MEPSDRVTILCVDDEPNVLEGVALHLRRRYAVVTAAGGALGLEALRRTPATAVVISDMRMPGMDGVAFLRTVREVAPDVVRILLTGQADLESAIAVVNEGQVFRFLTKPCPAPALLVAVNAAVDQHRLVTSERVLLEQTLHGSIKALTDVLSLTNPAAFGRATRVRQLVAELASMLRIQDRWQPEIAAMLSQVACMTLPAETAERFCNGERLSEPEQAMIDRLPAVTDQLLGNIPRLEIVRAILSTSACPRRSSPAAGGQDPMVELGAELLRAAIDFDLLEAQGSSSAGALEVLRSRGARYAPAVIEALDELRGGSDASDELREVPVAAVRVGMVVAADVRLESGALLMARGYEITPGSIERLRNFRGALKEPIRVLLRRGHAEAATLAAGGPLRPKVLS